MASNTQLAVAFLVSWVVFWIMGILCGSNLSSQIITIDSTQQETANQMNTDYHHTPTSTQPKKQRRFTDDQIRGVYNKYIVPKTKDRAYLSQYEWLSNATWFAPEFERTFWLHPDGQKFHFDISRIIQTASFRDYLSKYNILETHCNHVLTFNVGIDPEVQYFNGRFKNSHNISKCPNFTSLTYHPPQHKEGDLYTLDLDYKQWDVLILPQFLEHFHDVQLIMNNMFEHLRVGGYLYVTVPTVNIPHMTPFHYQHIQPMGLAMLALSAGFEIREIDFWGNQKYIEAIYDRHFWPSYTHFIQYEPFVNQPFYVSQTWGLFQKTSDN